MKQRYLLCILTVLLVGTQAKAVTWDEPWQEEILKKADSFVLLKIDSFDTEKGIWATIIQTIAGKPIAGNIMIDGFYALRLTSYGSGAGPQFRIPRMDTAYFFLVKGETTYQMPTPTAGFAWRRGNNVAATFRISMHKAPTPVAMYEKVMAELFAITKKMPYDTAYFKNLFEEYLTKLPGKVDGTETERALFFRQHIALESFYYIGTANYIQHLTQFLQSDQFHNQIGGVRALSAINNNESKQLLVSFIQDTTRNNLARVLAIDALRKLQARELARTLKKYLPKASTEDVGFGLDIMDVRNGVQIPANLHDGIEELLKEWR